MLFREIYNIIIDTYLYILNKPKNLNNIKLLFYDKTGNTKMSFCSFSQNYKKKSVTSIDNSFIYDYLPLADGNAVKIYIASLTLATNGKEYTAEDFAEFLKVDYEELISCYKFWEQYDLIKIVSTSPLKILINEVPLLNVKPYKVEPEKYSDFTSSLQALFPQRMISISEYSQYFQIMETKKIKPEALLLIIKYCIDLKGESVNYRYILAVINDFINRDLTTFKAIESELSDYVLNSNRINEILISLGLKRKAEIEDVKLFDKWTKDYGFTLESINFAVKTLKKAKIDKLDAFLSELYSCKLFSCEEIKSYVERKEYLKELTLKINKTLSVYYEVLEPEIDTYVKNWVNKGYNEQSLLFLAQYCFKSGIRNVNYLDEQINLLYNQGIVSFESIIKYFEQLNAENEYLLKLFKIVGINKIPVKWDRDNLATWKSWGFSESMIEKACELSYGKTSAFSYVNSVLSDWKSKNIFTVDKIPTSSQSKSSARFENEREYTQEYYDSLITKIAGTKL